MSSHGGSPAPQQEEPRIFGYGMAKLVILFLLLLVLYYVSADKKHENFGTEFRGLSYSAGADQRFQQEPSATNQLPYQTGYNMQILEQLPGVPPSTSEHMTTAQNKPALKHEEVLAEQLYREHLSASPDHVVESEIAAAHEFSA